MDHMKAAHIGTAIHYPIPLHLQKAYAGLHYATGDFPVAEKLSLEIVSLPMFPGLSAEQQARVVDEIHIFATQKREGRELEESSLASAGKSA
jgi:dTDP-4-amino-4,6-dideoxygalactose transaminase